MYQTNLTHRNTSLVTEKINASCQLNLLELATPSEYSEHHLHVVEKLAEKLRKHLSWSLEQVCVRRDAQSSIADSSPFHPDIWVETISNSPVSTQQVVETSLIVVVIKQVIEGAKEVVFEKLLAINGMRELVLINLINSNIEVLRRNEDGWVSSIHEYNNLVIIESIAMNFSLSEILVNYCVTDKTHQLGIVSRFTTPEPTHNPKLISLSKTYASVQVPYRVNFNHFESGRGYLIKLAEDLEYISPLIITNIIGAKIKGIDNEQVLNKLAPILRYSPQELKKHFYCQVGDSNPNYLRSFFGHTISSKYLNLQFPRLCTTCVTENRVIKAHWDINQITVCPIHRCELIDTCPNCKKSLVWHRAKILECKCGFNLSKLKIIPASKNILNLTKVIHKAIQPYLKQMVFENESNFSHELLKLSLPNLLKIIQFIGVSFGQNFKHTNRLNFKRNNLREGFSVVETAASVLAEWPNNYQEHLRIINDNYQIENPTERSVIKAYGSFYRQLFESYGDPQFNFLRDAFEQYLNKEWNGVYRTSLISNSKNIQSRWLTPSQASKLTDGLGIKGLRKLFTEGKITGIEKIVQTTGQRAIWLDRKSVETWVEKSSNKWMLAATAAKLLGINIESIINIAKFCLIDFEKGRIPGCESRAWLVDANGVKNIIEAFVRHQVPQMKYDKNINGLIALQHALSDMLSQNKGIPSVIKAVIDGELIPNGRAGNFAGIRDYIFKIEDLCKHRLIDKRIPINDYLNLGEIERILGVHRCVVTLLHKNRFIGKPTKYIKGRGRFILASSVAEFKAKYIFTKDLAKSIRTSANWVDSYLGSKGIMPEVLKKPDGNNVTLYEINFPRNMKMLPSNDKRVTELNKILKSL